MTATAIRASGSPRRSSAFAPDLVRRIRETDEVRIEPDSTRTPVTIWAVSVGRNVYVRSYLARKGGWYRAVIATPVEEPEQGLHRRPVEVGVGFLPEHLDRPVPIECFSIWTVGDQHVVGVGHRDDPGLERDGLAPQSLGVPGPVHALVMCIDDLGLAPEIRHPRQDLVAHLGMTLDNRPLGRVQRPRLAQDGIRDADLAHIV